MTLAVTGSSLDERLVIRYRRLLVGLRDTVDIAAEGDHRRAGAPAGKPCGGNAGNTALDLEAVGLENAGHIGRGLDLLLTQLREREDLVDHHLHELGSRADTTLDIAKQLVKPGLLGFRQAPATGISSNRTGKGRMGRPRSQGWMAVRERVLTTEQSLDVGSRRERQAVDVVATFEQRNDASVASIIGNVEDRAGHASESIVGDLEAAEQIIFAAVEAGGR